MAGINLEHMRSRLTTPAGSTTGYSAMAKIGEMSDFQQEVHDALLGSQIIAVEFGKRGEMPTKTILAKGEWVFIAKNPMRGVVDVERVHRRDWNKYKGSV